MASWRVVAHGQVVSRRSRRGLAWAGVGCDVEEPVPDGLGGGAAEWSRQADASGPATRPQALLKIVDLREPALRVFFGPRGYQMIQQVYADRLKNWADWRDLSVDAHGKL